MEKIIQSLVDGSAEPGGVGTGTAAATGEDAELHESMDDVEDVMKVLTDLGDEFARDVVRQQRHRDQEEEDKAALGDERFSEVSVRQEEIERRFFSLSRRLDLLRTRHLGAHAAEEICAVRARCAAALPPLPPVVPPKINPFDLAHVIRPPTNMPDGVVLPSVPSTEVLTAGTTSVSSMVNKSDTSTATTGTTDTSLNRDKFKLTMTPSLLPSTEERHRAQDALGQLRSNMKHLVQSCDSDATESSSGGESCDELDNFPTDNSHYAPIRKRAKYSWLSRRASVASKWTWLTAQISDLEYRIRQQTEFYRQIRAAKGGVTLGEPVVSWPPYARKPVQSSVRPDRDVPLDIQPVTRDYSRVDSQGRKIIIKEPSTLKVTEPAAKNTSVSHEPVNSDDDSSFGACRTRPVKMIRRRRILSMVGLYTTSVRAAKESTVRCDCIQSNFCCPICFGRANHTQVPDPVTQERRQCTALLDHSYHQVLSAKEDMPLDIKLSERLKNRSWIAEVASQGGSALKGPAVPTKKKVKNKGEEEGSDKTAEESGVSGKKNSKKNYPKKVRRDKNGRPVKKIKSRGADGKKLHRKSLTVHHHSDDRGVAINDLSSDGGDTISGVDGSSPIPSPSVPSSNQAWADHIRRKRETDFDINNIVIPYSMAASTRVEKLQYKEILTPTWRILDDEDCADLKEEEKFAEDISQSMYETRHAKAELEEQRRWQLPLWKSSGGQRSRASRRQDSSSCRTEASSGCNTPDPLSPGMVESLEVTTRPSTPVGGSSTNAPATAAGGGEVSEQQVSSEKAASIRNRRRTSSAAKSRDRNPSEDASQNSRCTTPTPQDQQQVVEVEVLPFESRSFPLDQQEYEGMVAEMPVEERPSEETVTLPTPAAPSNAEANPSLLTPVRTAGAACTSSRNSSSAEEDEEADEDTEEDPDWKVDAEDPDDPEWNGEETNSTCTNANKTHTKNQVNSSGINSANPTPSKNKKGLSLKMPK